MQVTLPQTSVHCTAALEQQLDTQLASLREQILTVSGTMSSAVSCMNSDHNSKKKLMHHEVVDTKTSPPVAADSEGSTASQA